jgi:hypothetical protein
MPTSSSFPTPPAKAGLLLKSKKSQALSEVWRGAANAVERPAFFARPLFNELVGHHTGPVHTIRAKNDLPAKLADHFQQLAIMETERKRPGCHGILGLFICRKEISMESMICR